MPERFRSKSARLAGLLTLASLFFFHPGALPLDAQKMVQWKAADQPMLRVDDHPVGEDWSVYLPPKKTSPVLVRIGTRYLLVDGRERKIFEVPPDLVVRRGADVYWDPSGRPGNLLETSNWLVKDVGLAYKVSARLVAENRVIDVQIPHPMDIRPLETR